MPGSPKIICLSNVFDQSYHDVRGEEIARCLSSNKRRDLFACLTQATGRELIVLSSPPRAAKRRSGKWLRAIETRFSDHRQLFSCNWDIPKLRVPLSWVFYLRHVFKHTRSGDLIIIDNYEFIYVLAAWFLKLFKRVNFVLDYEDGKHLIDRSWSRVLSASAEFFGRPLIKAAILAHPSLRQRLPKALPTLVVPGFIRQTVVSKHFDGKINFLYSGSLDHTRGIDLALKALEFLPSSGWHLHISGAGELTREIQAAQTRYPDILTFHATLSDSAFSELLSKCHVGLNCQRASSPISGVTFPSKIFTYLSANMIVVSSRASDVPFICGDACQYYDDDTPSSLAKTLVYVIQNYKELALSDSQNDIINRYSIKGTVHCLRECLANAQIL